MLMMILCAVVGQACSGPGCGPAAMGPAVIEVSCPAGATLLVDEYRVAQMGAERRLATPDLPMGERYFYTLRLMEDGRETQRRRVVIGAGETVRVDLRAVAEATRNFGLDLSRLKASDDAKVSLNGRPISEEEAKRRLTVIGSVEGCQKVMAELAGPLRELAAEYVVKQYRPTNWAVAQAGFKTDGVPTVYAQEPDGKVLFRQDDGVDLRKNLEAVRKGNPDYKPEKDPDYRKAGLVEDAWFAIGCSIVAAGLLLVGWRW